MATKSRSKFSPLKKRNDETEAGENDHEIMSVTYTPTSSSSTFNKEDDLSNVYTVEEGVQKIGFGIFQVLLSFFCGAIGLVEAFEVMILAVLSAALKCDWNLDEVQMATITTVKFFGELIGTPIWGTVADKFGRKKAQLGALIWSFVFGVISAFSPNYYVLLLFRGLVGLGLGGGILSSTYCIEFLPAKSRATILCLLEFAWAIGSILEALLALLIMTSIDHQPWRWLLGVSALPLLVMILLFPLVPESPRYLIFHGKEKKAKKVLEYIAWVNCRPTFLGRLVTQEKKEQLIQEKNRMFPHASEIIEIAVVESESPTNDIVTEPKDYGTLPSTKESCHQSIIDSDVTNDSDHELLIASDECTHRRTLSRIHIKQMIKEKAITYYHWFLILFKNGYWKTTLLLWYLWFAASVIYYGGTLLTTSLFQYDKHCGLKDDNYTDDGTCKPLSKSDYIYLVWTTCAEFPGTIWIIVLLLITGRKKSMALTTAAAAVCNGLLLLCLGKTVLTVFLFGVRGFATGFNQVIVLYTPEVYPTSVRGFGISLCSAFSCFGAMCAPFFAQLLQSIAYSVFVTSSSSLMMPLHSNAL